MDIFYSSSNIFISYFLFLAPCFNLFFCFLHHQHIDIKSHQSRILRQRQKCHGMSTMSQRTINDKFAFWTQKRTDLTKQNRRMKYHISKKITQLNNYELLFFICHCEHSEAILIQDRHVVRTPRDD